MEGYIGEIRLYAGTFCPDGWEFCDGSTYSINQYTAAFSILGTRYGGNGTDSFKVPDLRSRVAVGTGQGAGLPMVTLGEMGGSEQKTMTVAQMPTHNHVASATIAVPAYSHEGEGGTPQGSYLASFEGAYSTAAADTHIASAANTGALSSIGSGLPFDVIQPVLALNYIICINGIYPMRD